MCPPLRMSWGQVPRSALHSGSIKLLWPHSQVGQAVLEAPVQAPEVPSLLGSPLPGAAMSLGVPGANYPNGRRLARCGRYSLIQFTLKCNLIFHEAGGQPPAHPATFPPLQCSLLPALLLFPLPPRHREEPFSTGIPSPHCVPAIKSPGGSLSAN